MNARKAVVSLTTLLALAALGFFLYRWRAKRMAPPPMPAHNPVRTVRAAPPPPPRPLDAAPAADPPRNFRGDAMHTGRSGYRLPRRPRVLRTITTGARISSQPVVARDGKLVFGSHDGVIYGADIATGAIAWRLNTGDRVYPTALVAPSGAIFVGTDADRMVSLTARGRLALALATLDDADTSATMAPDGTLRFTAGDTLFSADAELTVAWRLQLAGKLFSSPVALADGSTVLGSQDDAVYRIDAAGAVRWRVATGGDVDATPAVLDGVVYVGSDDGSVYALDAETGRERWRRALGGYVRAGAALGLDQSVVVGTFGPSPRLVSLDRATGAVRWSAYVTGPPSAEYGIAAGAVVDREGRYAVGVPSDQLWIVERDGTVSWRVALPDDVDSGPSLVADGVIAVGCDDGAMYLLGE